MKTDVHFVGPERRRGSQGAGRRTSDTRPIIRKTSSVVSNVSDSTVTTSAESNEALQAFDGPLDEGQAGADGTWYIPLVNGMVAPGNPGAHNTENVESALCVAFLSFPYVQIHKAQRQR